MFTVHPGTFHPRVAITEQGSNDADDNAISCHLQSILCARYRAERFPCLVKSSQKLDDIGTYCVPKLTDWETEAPRA